MTALNPAAHSIPETEELEPKAKAPKASEASIALRQKSIWATILAAVIAISAPQATAVEMKGMLKSKEVKALVANAKTPADHMKHHVAGQHEDHRLQDARQRVDHRVAAARLAVGVVVGVAARRAAAVGQLGIER